MSLMYQNKTDFISKKVVKISLEVEVNNIWAIQWKSAGFFSSPILSDVMSEL